MGQGWATTAEENLLRSHMANYELCQVSKKYTAFWPIVFSAYLAAFPLTEQLWPGQNKTMAGLTEDENKLYFEKLILKQNSIREWFRWRGNPRSRNTSTAVSTKDLKKIYQPGRTRGHKSYEVFAKMYPEIFDHVYEESCRVQGAGATQRLPIYHRVAARLWDEATEEQKAAVKAKVESEAEMREIEEEKYKDGDARPEAYQHFQNVLPGILTAAVDPAVRRAGMIAVLTMIGPVPETGGQITATTLQFGDSADTPLFSHVWKGQHDSYVEALGHFAQKHEFPEDVCKKRRLNVTAEGIEGEDDNQAHASAGGSSQAPSVQAETTESAKKDVTPPVKKGRKKQAAAKGPSVVEQQVPSQSGSSPLPSPLVSPSPVDSVISSPAVTVQAHGVNAPVDLFPSNPVVPAPGAHAPALPPASVYVTTTPGAPPQEQQVSEGGSMFIGGLPTPSSASTIPGMLFHDSMLQDDGDNNGLQQDYEDGQNETPTWSSVLQQSDYRFSTMDQDTDQWANWDVLALMAKGSPEKEPDINLPSSNMPQHPPQTFFPPPNLSNPPIASHYVLTSTPTPTPTAAFDMNLLTNGHPNSMHQQTANSQLPSSAAESADLLVPSFSAEGKGSAPSSTEQPGIPASGPVPGTQTSLPHQSRPAIHPIPSISNATISTLFSKSTSQLHPKKPDTSSGFVLPPPAKPSLFGNPTVAPAFQIGHLFSPGPATQTMGGPHPAPDATPKPPCLMAQETIALQMPPSTSHPSMPPLQVSTTPQLVTIPQNTAPGNTTASLAGNPKANPITQRSSLGIPALGAQLLAQDRLPPTTEEPPLPPTLLAPGAGIPPTITSPAPVLAPGVSLPSATTSPAPVLAPAVSPPSATTSPSSDLLAPGADVAPSTQPPPSIPSAPGGDLPPETQPTTSQPSPSLPHLVEPPLSLPAPGAAKPGRPCPKKVQRKTLTPIAESPSDQPLQDPPSNEDQNAGIRRSARGSIKNTWFEKQNLIGTNIAPLPSTSTAASDQTDDELPPWFSAAVEYLKDNSLGEEWRMLLYKWAQLEASLRFGKVAKTPLPVANRPEEWHKWTAKAKRGVRAYDKIPVIEDPAEFGLAVSKWWCTIQPPFRVSDQGVLLSTYSNPASEGDVWAPLRRSGPNGFSVLIMLLDWWGRSAHTASSFHEDSRSRWSGLVRDVGRCLDEMCKPVGVNNTKRTNDDDEDEEDDSPNKRQKVA